MVATERSSQDSKTDPFSPCFFINSVLSCGRKKSLPTLQLLLKEVVVSQRQVGEAQ